MTRWRVALQSPGPRAASGLALWLAGAVLACVPTTDESEPKGAVGYTVTATPASMGAPSQTADGYVVTIERLVVHLYLGVSKTEGIVQTSFGEHESLIFPASTPAVLLVRAIPVGLVSPMLRVGTRYSTRDQGIGSETLALTADELVRLSVPADLSQNSSSAADHLPNLLLIARGVRGTRTTRMNIAFDLRPIGRQRTADATLVRANALVVAPARIQGETLFSDALGSLRFASFEAADADRDGVLTAQEMLAAGVSEEERQEGLEPDGPFPHELTNLAEVIYHRAGKLLQE